MNKKLSVLTMFGLFTLASCGGNSNSKKVSITISNDKASVNKVVKSDEVTMADTLYSIQEDLLIRYKYFPSIGDQKLLIIPVIVPGYETVDIDNDGVDDKERVIDDLDKCFFGKGTEYESVSSFYEKSSYGHLKLTGEVTNWFDIAKDSNLSIKNAGDITLDSTYDVANAAVNWVKKNTTIDLTEYDSDEDGYVDGVWLVYSAPDYSNGGPLTDDYNYWAYTTWGNLDGSETKPSKYAPAYSLFGWASYDFMYTGYGVDKIDTHTYIHETGHFLGLSDYYSDNNTYKPLGQTDMMDGNIIDHNSFSKMLLGWTKPTIVSGNATIDLRSMDNENSVIVIPSDDYDGSSTFDPFGEYLMLELYNNTGLNYHDSVVTLEEKALAPSEPGVRLYHVNKSKYYASWDGYEGSIKRYEGETLIDENHGIVLPITNQRGWTSYNEYLGLSIEDNLQDELRLIEATNKNTFNYGGYQKSTTYFHEGDVFSLEKYGNNFFLKGDKFDNGKACSAVIEIGGITNA